jgi:hypothetical protein
VTASSGIRLLAAYSVTPSRLLGTTVPFLATHGDPHAHVCAPIHRWCLIPHPYESALWRIGRKEQESKLTNMMILRNSSSSGALLVQDPLPLHAAAEVSDGTQTEQACRTITISFPETVVESSSTSPNF